MIALVWWRRWESMRLYESSRLDEYVRTDGHRNGWPSSKKKAVVEAVGIEPYCQRYANPTRTLGFSAYRYVKHATRALTRVPCSTLESPRLPWALVIIWSLTTAARASLRAVVSDDAGQVRCAELSCRPDKFELARVDHASAARRAQITRFRQMTPGERWIAARIAELFPSKILAAHRRKSSRGAGGRARHRQ